MGSHRAARVGIRPRMRLESPVVSHAFVVIGVAWVLLTFMLQLPASVRAWSMVAMALAALIVCAAALRLSKFEPRWTGWAMVLALAAFVLARVGRIQGHTVNRLIGARSLMPAVIEAFGYILIGAALLRVSRRRRGSTVRRGIAIIDHSVIALAAIGSAWIIALGPLVFRNGSSLNLRLTLISHPAMSIILVGIALRFPFAVGERRGGAYWYLLSSLSMLCLGDLLFLLVRIGMEKPLPIVLDVPYGLAYIAAGATFLHPKFAWLSKRQTERTPLSQGSGIVWIAVSLVMPLLLTVQAAGNRPWDRPAAYWLAGILAVMASGRMFYALRTTDRLQTELAKRALYDDLTGLPNRNMVESEVRRVWEIATQKRSSCAVLYVNLDGFRLLNTTFGRARCDQVLVNVANCLLGGTTPDDAVVRVGDDDFVVAMSGVQDAQTAAKAAKRLQLCLAGPMNVLGSEIRVSATIGLALSAAGPSGSCSGLDDIEALIHAASTAVREARREDTEKIAIFDEPMRKAVVARSALEADMLHAAERGELRVEYQPIVSLPSGMVSGAEALLRWEHPTLGMLAPASFISLAEETGDIESMGGWILEQALKQVASWRQCPDLSSLTIAVNVSAVQLGDHGFVSKIKEGLQRYNLPGSALCLELTESVVMRDPASAARIFAHLRELDVSLALDDFGTAYSSLAYLHCLPANHLKIDRSFVAGESGPSGSASTLLEAIVAMAQALGIETVAEGVETQFELERVLTLGCDSVQGFLYSKPVSSDEMVEVTRAIRQSALTTQAG